METVYCIYSDAEIPIEKTNVEHIIPLSLGGCNAFTIKADAIINSKLGTEVDGLLFRDFLISGIRRRKDYRGHNNKEPETRMLNATYTDANKPIHITHKRSKAYFYDPVRKRNIPEAELKGESFNFLGYYNKFSRMRFTAKVLLSGGYFAFGDIFREYADHNSLRRLMNITGKETIGEVSDIDVGITDPFHEWNESQKPMVDGFKQICKGIDGSCVLFLYRDDCIIGSVGIGGEYIASITFKAKIEHFPNTNTFRKGHIIGIQGKKLSKCSFYKMALFLNSNDQLGKK